ncbi:acyltransferase family protein [Ramlibacter sp. MMS24-I3-19]|uniref:acyltransferase family protein n=1 Tax=Ramlibacter sp. MMS24-I3-19 TaxID=3416606 RepID=UPI003D0426D8
MQRLLSLEMLRGIAALLVVMFHAQSIFGTRTETVPFFGAFANGDKGVDLFFVLSGFIITHTHAHDIGRPDRLGNYAFNRISRIYPAVWIMTILAGIVYSLGFGGADKTEKIAAWNIAASALLLPQHGDALVNVTWTLKYELCFYVVFSMLVLNRSLGLALLFLWQGSVLAVSLLGLETNTLATYYLQPICLEFCIGIGCATLVLRRDAIPALASQTLQRLMFVVGTLGFLGGALLQTYGPESAKSLPRVAVYGCSAGLIILSLVLAELDGRLRVGKPLIYLGGASYAIYLAHYSVMSLLGSALEKVQMQLTGALIIVVVLAAVAASIAFHELVDRPIQRMLRRAWRERFARAQSRVATSS